MTLSLLLHSPYQKTPEGACPHYLTCNMTPPTPFLYHNTYYLFPSQHLSQFEIVLYVYLSPPTATSIDRYCMRVGGVYPLYSFIVMAA